MVILVLALLLSTPAAAHGATRYAAPAGSDKSACSAADPCSLQRAVKDAHDGDDVIAGPGVYNLKEPLKPAGGVSLHGDRDHAWPRLVGDPALKASLLTINGGTVCHVSLEATAAKQTALTLKGGTADAVRLLSPAGAGGAVAASKAGTVMRNSVVIAGTQGLSLTGGGDVALRNDTVMATATTGVGIRSDVDGSATLVNVLVRGGKTDVEGHKGTATAAFSNFRPDHVSGLGPGAGNQSAEPLFADADYRPAAGSPTIDAGALDAFAASPDPDGRPRSLGAAPDIGAYEFVPAAAPGGGETGAGTTGPEAQMPPALRGVPAPAQGVSVVVAAARGTIRIRRPGAASFETLDAAGRVPVGSVLDARRGRVRLVSAIGAGGAVQSGVFWGTRFKATQSRHGGGMTTLTLRGHELRACRTARAHGSAIALASKKKRKRVRSLWGRDHHGRFRTHGHDSVATARGTAWLTRETCAGTLTRVRDGAVSVRDLHRHRRVLVKAGHSYLARR